MNRTFGVVEAISSLTPGAQWTLNGDEYAGLDWLDEEQTQPTEQECIAEAARLQAAYDALEYQRLRAPEYPPITDYLDGIAKSDKAQVDAYVAACKAVKAKYPKPE